MAWNSSHRTTWIWLLCLILACPSVVLEQMEPPHVDAPGQDHSHNAPRVGPQKSKKPSKGPTRTQAALEAVDDELETGWVKPVALLGHSGRVRLSEPLNLWGSASLAQRSISRLQPANPARLRC